MAKSNSSTIIRTKNELLKRKPAYTLRSHKDMPAEAQIEAAANLPEPPRSPSPRHNLNVLEVVTLFAAIYGITSSNTFLLYLACIMAAATASPLIMKMLVSMLKGHPPFKKKE